MELLLLGGIEVDDLVGDDRPDPDLGDLRVLDLAQDLLVDRRAGLGDRLAAIGQDEVLGQHLAERVGLLSLAPTKRRTLRYGVSMKPCLLILP